MARKQPKPGAILWGYWANQMCLGGGICLFLSSLMAFHPVFSGYDTGTPTDPGKPGDDTYWRFSGPWAL